MDIRRYFDLSEPVTFRPPRPAPHTGGAPSPAATSARKQSPQLPLLWQILTYCILLASILASRFLDLHRAGVLGDFTLDWAYLLSMAIVSLVAFPVVYDRARLNRGQPVFLQIVLIFSAGMGWEKIVATAIGK